MYHLVIVSELQEVATGMTQREVESHELAVADHLRLMASERHCKRPQLLEPLLVEVREAQAHLAELRFCSVRPPLAPPAIRTHFSPAAGWKVPVKPQAQVILSSLFGTVGSQVRVTQPRSKKAAHSG